MCTPKTPEVEKTPARQAAKLPDNGDPTVAASKKARRRLGPSALIFSGTNGALGAPSVTGLGA